MGKRKLLGLFVWGSLASSVATAGDNEMACEKEEDWERKILGSSVLGKAIDTYLPLKDQLNLRGTSPTIRNHLLPVTIEKKISFTYGEVFNNSNSVKGFFPSERNAETQGLKNVLQLELTLKDPLCIQEYHPESKEHIDSFLSQDPNLQHVTIAIKRDPPPFEKRPSHDQLTIFPRMETEKARYDTLRKLREKLSDKMFYKIKLYYGDEYSALEEWSQNKENTSFLSRVVSLDVSLSTPEENASIQSFVTRTPNLGSLRKRVSSPAMLEALFSECPSSSESQDKTQYAIFFFGAYYDSLANCLKNERASPFLSKVTSVNFVSWQAEHFNDRDFTWFHRLTNLRQFRLWPFFSGHNFPLDDSQISQMLGLNLKRIHKGRMDACGLALTYNVIK